VAACLLLVTRAGTSISTVTKYVAPAARPAAAPTVEPVEKIATFSEVAATKVGSMQVESIPAGAEAVVDGRSYGPTPVTIPDLAVGSHTLVLKSTAGTVSKKIAIKANETALVSEAIFSGWLAIFSPIPINVVVDGQPVSLSEEGRVMVPPGKHVIALISDRFNYRSSETVQVMPGETTAHTVILPTGSVRVTAPSGVQVRIDGQAADGIPSEGLAVPIGSHEISGVHPDLGERRVTVDVRQGALTEVTLPFAQ
jgi:hypothetical protein